MAGASGAAVGPRDVLGCFDDEDVGAVAAGQGRQLSDGDIEGLESEQASSDVEGDDMDMDGWGAEEGQQQEALQLREDPRLAQSQQRQQGQACQPPDAKRGKGAAAEGSTPPAAGETGAAAAAMCKPRSLAARQGTAAAQQQAAALQALLMASGMIGYPGAVSVQQHGMEAAQQGLSAALTQQLQQAGYGAFGAQGAAGAQQAAAAGIGGGGGMAALQSLQAMAGFGGMPPASAAGGPVNPLAALFGGAAADGPATYASLQGYLAAAAGEGGGMGHPPKPTAANMQALLQDLRAPVPQAAAGGGPLNVDSVYRQLSLLYAWYASSRAAYLEQVRSSRNCMSCHSPSASAQHVAVALLCLSCNSCLYSVHAAPGAALALLCAPMGHPRRCHGHAHLFFVTPG
jgi:hypothetical protein